MKLFDPLNGFEERGMTILLDGKFYIGVAKLKGISPLEQLALSADQEKINEPST